MDVLRRYLWLWVVGGMVLASLLISFIFLFINRCISRAGKQTIARLKRRADFNVESNKYQERSPDTPPLPPRTQFLQTGSQSYENLAQEKQQLHSSDLPPDDLRVEDEVDLQPPVPLYQRPLRHLKAGVTAVQTCHNPAEEHDYEQSTADGQQKPAEEHDYEQSTADGQQNPAEEHDYVRVKDEVDPHVCPSDTAQDSSEDYDDIGGEEDEDEDYDDVG